MTEQPSRGPGGPPEPPSAADVTSRRTTGPTPGPALPDRPSRWYRAEIWRLGLVVIRCLPRPVAHGLGRFFAWLFWHLDLARREVAIQNLSPVLRGDEEAAQQTARRLYRNFSRKLADLWWYESGRRLDHLFGDLEGADLFRAAVASRRGVLLVTIHLGNWEFGAPLMSLHGQRVLALTLAEPHDALTHLRRASRARYGIETLVIQQDPFAFVEVIRRLEAGATVALLVDRPPASTAVTVELFGRSFAASVAPAELARASGCVVLPVYLAYRPNDRYSAHVLPEVIYDRASLRRPAARRDLTQRILRAFEPILERHTDQWYHFVPVWPAPDPTPAPSPSGPPPTTP